MPAASTSADAGSSTGRSAGIVAHPRRSVAGFGRPAGSWDALIVRTAQSARCDVLYTEDLQHGRSYGGLRVVNPFAST